MYLAIVLVGALAAVVHSYPVTNPFCETDYPIHGAKPQTGPFPYEIIVEKPNLKAGESTKVTIKGKGDEVFRGFVITAKLGDKRVGTFSSINEQTSITDCGPGGNAATMADFDDKNKVELNWTAPADLKGTINFHVMIVKVFDIIWISKKSGDVTLS